MHGIAHQNTWHVRGEGVALPEEQPIERHQVQPVPPQQERLVDRQDAGSS